tara:strand:+ start:10401 stop:10781 length:381 start_codon:yes stop_codon:yes gene_type:complete
MILISLNQDGVMDAVADLGDASAKRYSSAINILAKFVAVLVVSLNLTTSLTLLAVALMMIVTFKRFAYLVISRKHMQKAKKFKIFLAKKTGGSQFIFWPNPADTTPPPTRKKKAKSKLFFRFSESI